MANYRKFCRGWLSFQKTGLSFGLFEWKCVEFFLKASIAKITVFEVKGVFWPADWNLSGTRTSSYVKFLLDLCVCRVFWQKAVWYKQFVNLVYS